MTSVRPRLNSLTTIVLLLIERTGQELLSVFFFALATSEGFDGQDIEQALTRHQVQEEPPGTSRQEATMAL
jgi:hypothetical protein